ncbi:MAG: type I restriction endonuclease subunit R [Leptospiraceae bacterium]|nr:type I restriction endonuclease subunit R [Leptospiraceae bacterium]MDW7976388.1 type I restriction endonuclease subunit R [Leptospiraceae bacterium]
MKFGSEKYAVQNPILSYVREAQTEYNFANTGWHYISKDELSKLRLDNNQIILENIFLSKIKSLNPFLSDDEAKEVLKQLKGVRPDIEGNLTVWQFLKGLRSLYIQSEKRQRNIRLIDTENINNNDFHVTEEFEFTNGIRSIRQDVVFFINGIPVIFIEAKAPYVLQGMDIALEQVLRYHRECPELLAVEQVLVLTHLIKFLYGSTWNANSKNLYNWKEELRGDFESLVKAFFDRERIVRLITDYILFVRKDELLQKVILRPHQMRAVERVIDRAKDKQKRRGLIWHTQGSGKTYTMIVIAKKLIEDPVFENSTVIMLVDRNELESQLFGNIQAVGIEHVEVAESKKHLQRILKEQRKGLIVSTIHKFEGMPEKMSTRDNIFVLIDEAHRTTSGKLGNYLMGALPNATYIGFTGTPIDKTSRGKNTFLIFGREDPPKGYLDKYSIAESIEDGTTVPIHYKLAPNELRIDKELLEKEFFELKETEGLSDIEELNSLLDKAINLKNAIKSVNRIERVAEYIAKHYKEYVEPLGYKAFVVAVDREACALYKEKLDKHLPEDYSKVIYSPHYNDPEFMARYHLSEEEEKRIRKNFLDPEAMPKILIVTNKLLTGFDAPVLYAMYLDKPMRDHVLLQTIARINRPYEDKEGRKKPAGLVIDFIGIFERLEKALAFDSTDIEGIIKDIEVLKERFLELIEEAKTEYLEYLRQHVPEDKKVEFILGYFSDKEKREDFYSFFKELNDIYNILSPDEFLRPYLSDMETLTRIYKIVLEAYDPSVKIKKALTTKIEELLRKNVKQSEIKDALEVYEINEHTIKILEEKNISEQEKVFNLSKSIAVHIQKEGHNFPYLLSIGERAEKIMSQFRNKQITTKEALSELKKILDEINHSRQEQIAKGMKKDEFTIYWILKQEQVETPKENARECQIIMDQYPYWKSNQAQEREIKKRILALLDKIVEPERASAILEKIIDTLKEEGN